MRFSDIKRFTPFGPYSVHVGLAYLDFFLKDLDGLYGLDLEPDFQRGHVWDDERRIRYMEFFLRGGRSGRDILFNCRGWNRESPGAKVVLVDGLQRLTAARMFMRNELPVFGQFRKDFGDDPDHIRHRFSVHINDLPTQADVLVWYLELNSGGVVHTEEELQKVLDLLREERGAAADFSGEEWARPAKRAAEGRP